jgi:SsrA-binding protein
MESYIESRKVRFNYELLENFTAGIELFGFEVKSVRAGHGSLEGAHIIIRGGEAYIVGMKIDPYQPNNTPPGYDRERTRKLLITKKEIQELVEADDKKGLTMVPLSLYNKNGKVKLAFATARGKKKFDKRETIKKRDSDRDIGRLLKR